MTILVTGATGNLGSKVVETLLKSIPAQQLAVSVRTPEKAVHLKERGVDVRQADFDQPDTLATAFQGVDRLLIISADGDNETRIKQHANAVTAAKAANVKFLAYTSLANATDSTNLMAPPHKATEAAIIESGIPYSFLRNNWYLENESGSIQGAIAGGTWLTSAGEGKVGWALQQDYADAAAAVLLGAEHDHTTYELSGQPLTQAELVAELSEVINKEVTVQHVNDEAYGDAMKQAGVPEAALPIVVGIQASIRNGSLDVTSNDFEKVLGRPATPIKEALTQIVNNLN
ncbi:NAD(P)H dehydrogenase (quinone) [Amphibacillus marinus]|uniref:NAD(P)H dehydrogenase (Quinone) n=1 Tax=Amphibacillus marinus TaxID=872970 RepID=A0A1H8TBG8_9BACI|nr:SDR family oxidoreductase [Amphibacillus marinus]SEO88242.1 NAD(P)H dehydrogenase (quinone) [Amphibacillus marinus]